MLSPIAILVSLSYISGVTVLGIPAEMYLFGTQYWMSVTVEVFVNITMIFAYLPIFYTLQITSSYEMLYIPVVIYIPALAFSQEKDHPTQHIVEPSGSYSERKPNIHNINIAEVFPHEPEEL
uniref:Uncharacterized protein n=1 Tax=Timema tahoe TaxID=61484 RepID=A0A7R9IAK8_9NEOP|nr:unnamed protein product [Timema tahoe]